MPRYYYFLTLGSYIPEGVKISLKRKFGVDTNPHGREIKTIVQKNSINPLESRGNYSATSNNMKLVHWPLMGGLLHLVQ